MPNEVQEKAFTIVTEHLESKGYVVEDIRHSKRAQPGRRGYNVIARKVGEPELKITVKGSTRLWGIPDPYVSEFDEERRLIADYLYVVFMPKDQPAKLCAVPRDAFNSDDVVEKRSFRFKSHVKKQDALERFVVIQ